MLTVSRRIYFLSGIYQHLKKAPQKKKKTKNCTSVRQWRHHDATSATLQQNRFIENTSAEIRPISFVSVRGRGIFRLSRWRCWKDYRQQGVKQFCKIRKTDKRCTENLSKIYLRRQCKWTKYWNVFAVFMPYCRTKMNDLVSLIFLMPLTDAAF